MTSPVIANTTKTSNESDATVHSINLPVTSSLAVIIIGGVDGTPGVTSAPSGFTEILNETDASSGGTSIVWGRNTGDGSSTTSVTFDATETWNSVAFTVDSWDGDIANIVLSAFNKTTGSNPDPPGITGLTSGDWTYVAAFVKGHGGFAYTSGPSGYTEMESETGGGAAQCGYGTAYLQTTSSTGDDPGVFTAGNSRPYTAWTMAFPESGAAPAGGPVAGSLSLLGTGI